MRRRFKVNSGLKIVLGALVVFGVKWKNNERGRNKRRQALCAEKRPDARVGKDQARSQKMRLVPVLNF